MGTVPVAVRRHGDRAVLETAPSSRPAGIDPSTAGRHGCGVRGDLECASVAHGRGARCLHRRDRGSVGGPPFLAEGPASVPHLPGACTTTRAAGTTPSPARRRGAVVFAAAGRALVRPIVLDGPVVGRAFGVVPLVGAVVPDEAVCVSIAASGIVQGAGGVGRQAVARRPLPAARNVLRGHPRWSSSGARTRARSARGGTEERVANAGSTHDPVLPVPSLQGAAV